MPSLNEPVISMKNVSCVLGNRAILNDINWTVHPGEHWAVIGLNGSGKTTLLNIINGYIFPSRGELRVLGKLFGSFDWRTLRRQIGFISTSVQEKFYGSETAEEIVLSGMFATIGLYDRVGKKDRERALALLNDLSCDHIVNQRYDYLSQGEKQKVLIARALIRSPQLLLMDEPCAGLDIVSREQLLEAIGKLGNRRHAPTILYVSHHIEEILPVFTHTLLIRGGSVYTSGPTRKVLNSRSLSSFLEIPVEVHWRNNRPWVQA